MEGALIVAEFLEQGGFWEPRDWVSHLWHPPGHGRTWWMAGINHPGFVCVTQTLTNPLLRFAIPLW